MASESDLSHVGRAVAARRGQLGMTQQDLADAGGVDLKTVYNLESGGRWPIAKTRVAVSAALRWQGDALAVIRAGGTPCEAAPAEDSPPPARQQEPEEEGGPVGAPLAIAGLQPYIDGVERAVRLAESRYGPDFTGADAFGAGGDEAAVWDAPRWRIEDDPARTRENRVHGVAVYRMGAAAAARRTGLTDAVASVNAQLIRADC